jgi:hypothetical protein
MIRVVIVTAIIFLMGCQSKPDNYLNESNLRGFAVHLYAQVLVDSCSLCGFEKYKDFTEQVFTENLFKNLIKVHEKSAEKGICCIDTDIFTDSQELISGFLIDSVEQKGDFAVVAVCTGMDVKSIKSPALYLHLARISGKWRISDIIYVKNKSLRSLHDMLVSCLDGEQSAEFY